VNDTKRLGALIEEAFLDDESNDRVGVRETVLQVVVSEVPLAGNKKETYARVKSGVDITIANKEFLEVRSGG
jgi:hypothetical protein